MRGCVTIEDNKGSVNWSVWLRQVTDAVNIFSVMMMQLPIIVIHICPRVLPELSSLVK